MRLKTLNINDRSEAFSLKTSNIIKCITRDINKIGLMFDKFIELETFIMTNVLEELEELVDVRNKRKNIEKEESTNVYINDFFKPAAMKLSKKIDIIIEEWDLMNTEFTSIKINRICEYLQVFKKFISNLIKHEIPFTTIDIIKDIINDFGRFQSIRCMTSKNIVVRIEMLLISKENILKIKENSDYLDEIDIDNLSIDDL